jgi:hypothetical protein
VNDFKTFIDMLAIAKLKYAQIDHGNGRSTLIVDKGRVHVDFTNGKLTEIRAL